MSRQAFKVGQRVVVTQALIAERYANGDIAVVLDEPPESWADEPGVYPYWVKFMTGNLAGRRAVAFGCELTELALSPLKLTLRERLALWWLTRYWRKAVKP